MSTRYPYGMRKRLPLLPRLRDVLMNEDEAKLASSVTPTDLVRQKLSLEHASEWFRFYFYYCPYDQSADILAARMRRYYEASQAAWDEMELGLACYSGFVPYDARLQLARTRLVTAIIGSNPRRATANHRRQLKSALRRHLGIDPRDCVWAAAAHAAKQQGLHKLAELLAEQTSQLDARLFRLLRLAADLLETRGLHGREELMLAMRSESVETLQAAISYSYRQRPEFDSEPDAQQLEPSASDRS